MVFRQNIGFCHAFLIDSLVQVKFVSCPYIHGPGFGICNRTSLGHFRWRSWDTVRTPLTAVVPRSAAAVRRQGLVTGPDYLRWPVSLRQKIHRPCQVLCRPPSPLLIFDTHPNSWDGFLANFIITTLLRPISLFHSISATLEHSSWASRSAGSVAMSGYVTECYNHWCSRDGVALFMVAMELKIALKLWDLDTVWQEKNICLLMKNTFLFAMIWCRVDKKVQ